MKITFYYAPKNGLDEKLKVYNDLLGKLINDSYDNVYSCHYWLSRAIDLVTKDDILMVYWRL